MNREHAVWIGAVVVLLTIGLLIGRQFLAVPGVAPQAQRPAPVQSETAGSFRHWFWESRSLDLAAQVGLIFAGALGIAALLPRGKEEDV